MVSEMNQFAVVSGGPGLQALEAGFRFLSQSLKAGCGSESTESWPLDHQGPVVSDKALATCPRHVEMDFYVELQSSQTSKEFIWSKKEYLWLDTWLDSDSFTLMVA